MEILETILDQMSSVNKAQRNFIAIDEFNEYTRKS